MPLMATKPTLVEIATSKVVAWLHFLEGYFHYMIILFNNHIIQKKLSDYIVVII
jgi:uncharacterized membrane protein YiaA